jgi:hypothetical protein
MDILHVLWQHSNGTQPVPHPDPHLGRVDCSIFHGSIADLTALLHPSAPTPKDDPVTPDEIQKVAQAVLHYPIPDQLNDDKTNTNLASIARTLRKQSAANATRSTTDLAKAIIKALPAGGLTQAEMEAAFRTVLQEGVGP